MQNASRISFGRRVAEMRSGGLGGRVVHGQVGQDLAVHLDPGELQALDEAVVGHAIGAGARVDARDPQLAEVALAVTTVAVRVLHRVQHLLLGLAVQPGTLPTVAARGLEQGAALLLGVDRTLDACHFGTPNRGTCVARASAAQQLLDSLGVGLGHRDRTGHPASDLGGLALQQVALAGLLGEELALAGYLDPLAGPGVGLELRHLKPLSDLSARPRPGRKSLITLRWCRWFRPPASRHHRPRATPAAGGRWPRPSQQQLPSWPDGGPAP